VLVSKKHVFVTAKAQFSAYLDRFTFVTVIPHKSVNSFVMSQKEAALERKTDKFKNGK